MSPKPSLIVFLDFDDVLCLNTTVGGYDYLQLLQGSLDMPKEAFFEQIFSPDCKEILKGIYAQALTQFSVQTVISSSWRRILDKEPITHLLKQTGLGFITLHPQWCTPYYPRATRAMEITGWLNTNASPAQDNLAYLVIDDTYSGTGLKEAMPPLNKRCVLCKVNKGLTVAEVSKALKILHTLKKKAVQQ